jgi:Xaa-Pro aminopeptidase
MRRFESILPQKPKPVRAESVMRRDNGAISARTWIERRHAVRATEQQHKKSAEHLRTASVEKLVGAIDSQHEQRLTRTRELMQQQKIDVLIVAQTPSMISYDYGYLDSDAEHAPQTEGIHVITATGMQHVALPTQHGSDFAATLTRAVAAMTGEKHPRVGIEAVVEGELHERIAGAFKKSPEQPKLVSVVSEARREKSPEEIELMDRAQSELEHIMREVIPTLMYEGMTERELAQKIEQIITHEGAVPVSFPAIVAFGENGAVPHHKSGERTLKSGEPVLIDCGAVFADRVCSDMTRNYWFGAQGGELFNAYMSDYTSLQKAQRAIIERYRAGNATKEIDAAVRAEVGAIPHGLGHGIAQVSVHAAPNLSPKSEQSLRVGDVVSNEPGIYKPGQYGIRIEDVIAITKDGPRVFAGSTGPRDCIMVAARVRDEQTDIFETKTETLLAPEQVKKNIERLKRQMGEHTSIYVAAKTEYMTSKAVERVLGFKGTHGYLVLVQAPEAAGKIESYFVTDGRYAAPLAEWGAACGFTDCFVIRNREEKDGKVIPALSFEMIMQTLVGRAVERAGYEKHIGDIAIESGAMIDTEQEVARALRTYLNRDEPLERVHFTQTRQQDERDDSEPQGGGDITAFLESQEADPSAHFMDTDTSHE